jgi:hypothetical protein
MMIAFERVVCNRHSRKVQESFVILAVLTSTDTLDPKAPKADTPSILTSTEYERSHIKEYAMSAAPLTT